MKKLVALFICLFAVGVAAYADDDRPVEVSQLPAKAQEFVKKYFPDVKVSYAKMEQDLLDKTYEVVFVNGNKAEFTKKGEWKEVDCKYTVVPEGIVPAQIMKYVKEKHPDQKVVKIDRDSRDYEVKLNNGLELKFDLKFNLIGIDS